MTFRGTADDATVTRCDMSAHVIAAPMAPGWPHAYSCNAFHGMRTAPIAQVSRQVQLLRRAVAERGLRAQGPDFLLAAREQAGVRPALRRNDVLVQLQSFELW